VADFSHNHMLAALPQDQWQRSLPHLEHVEMPLGQVLYEPGSTLSHVYFPTTAIVSLLNVMQNGESAEIAVVGNQGVVGPSSWVAIAPPAGRSGKVRVAAPIGCTIDEGRVLSRRPRVALAAAVHPGSDYANGANRSV